MKTIRIRLLSLVFALVFFFQTHMLFSDAVIQSQEQNDLDNSEQSKKLSNYVLKPIQSIMRIALTGLILPIVPTGPIARISHTRLIKAVRMQ